MLGLYVEQGFSILYTGYVGLCTCVLMPEICKKLFNQTILYGDLILILKMQMGIF